MTKSKAQRREHTPKTTFIKAGRNLEATRSPVDGLWRAWVYLPINLAYDWTIEDYEEWHGVAENGAWVVLGVAQKARDAFEMARKAEKRLRKAHEPLRRSLHVSP